MPNFIKATVTRFIYITPSVIGGIEQKDYVFQLSVNGGASVSRVSIRVDSPPTANACPNQAITLPATSFSQNG